MLHDALSDTLSRILNAERTAKESCEIHPVSKVIKAVLDIMNKHGYVGKYETLTEAKGGVLRLHLLGHINKCGVIKPRFGIAKEGYEKYEQRYLPAQGFGILIVSTNKGIMTNDEAKKKKLGGRLVAYCY